MAQRTLEDLSREACLRLLAEEVVGRLVYVDDAGPAAVPVNYAMDGDAVVVRIEHSPKQLALREGAAFEVDRIDPTDHSGWSILIRGKAAEVPLDSVPELLHRIRTRFPRPWATGVHNVWIRIEPVEITGKRFGEPVP